MITGPGLVMTAVEVWSAMVIHTESKIDCFRWLLVALKMFVNYCVVAVALRFGVFGARLLSKIIIFKTKFTQKYQTFWSKLTATTLDPELPTLCSTVEPHS